MIKSEVTIDDCLVINVYLFLLLPVHVVENFKFSITKGITRHFRWSA